MAHTQQAPIPTQVLDGAVEDYPSDRKYWIVAGILAVFTFLEILAYVLEDSLFAQFPNDGPLIATLLVLMAIKLWCVAWYFMHLKFDKRILTVAFYSGIVLALTVYLCTLLMFRWFTPADSEIRTQ